MKIFVPPIKCQGIKTKLVGWIIENLDNNSIQTWYEPFMGSGVVGFNVRARNAVFSDINPHLINFYNEIKNGIITPSIAKEFLEKEGEILSKRGQEYYNEVRTRFNNLHNPLDFLFLNRSSFNGIIRFNRYGKYNVPFGHKPERFSKAYITKIINQIDYVQKAINIFNWEFVCQDFRKTIEKAKDGDLIYCDPPYIGRHTDYFNSWSEMDEEDLYIYLKKSKAKYILSTWYGNHHRKNEELEKYIDNSYVFTKEHFYHVGAKEDNRNPMTEALVLNYKPTQINITYKNTPLQLQLLEPRLNYEKPE